MHVSTPAPSFCDFMRQSFFAFFACVQALTHAMNLQIIAKCFIWRNFDAKLAQSGGWACSAIVYCHWLALGKRSQKRETLRQDQSTNTINQSVVTAERNWAIALSLPHVHTSISFAVNIRNRRINFVFPPSPSVRHVEST